MYIGEGNLGAGKTTFLKLIQERLPEIAVVFEPLHNWQSQVYGESILSNFYKDPQRWAYTMETLAMVCRVQEHLSEQENPNPFRLMERSIYSGHYVFATNGYQNGFLSELEWHVYLQWFNFLVTGRCKPPQGFIYLRTDPEVAYRVLRYETGRLKKLLALTILSRFMTVMRTFLSIRKGFLQSLLRYRFSSLIAMRTLRKIRRNLPLMQKRLQHLFSLGRPKQGKVSIVSPS